MTQTFTTEWGGKKLTIQTGKLAQQATASVVVTCGQTTVLGTVVISPGVRTGIDFFPLTVEYEEKLYAAGKIKSSRFIKREGRPTDDATLIGRMIDRAIRPLFDDRMRNEVQVVLSVLSFDHENSPDVLGLVAAAAALQISKIPWKGPLAGIRIGRVGSEWVINPSYEALAKSELDIIVAGNEDKVVMIEADGSEVPEDVVYDAILFGQKHLKPVLKLIEEVKEKVGQKKIDPLDQPATQAETQKEMEELIERATKEFILPKIDELFFNAPKDNKVERREAYARIEAELDAWLAEQEIGKEKRDQVLDVVAGVIEEQTTKNILENDRRVDSRKIDEVRPLSSEVALFERNHGTGLFQRGETQVLTVATLGAPGDEQTLDGMEITGKKRFMHHYNFPPFSVGEVKPMRGPGRREIGHGALAEKALERMMPAKENFPYTIRLVSEVLSSNGSSSMGATCGSTLALMDAGVPIKAPIAGVAMGLASNADKNGDVKDWKVITDLQDFEDGEGGMDFKIAGSKTGITAIQLDTKTTGISKEIVRETLDKAKTARLTILDVMLKAIPEPRKELSPYAPRIVTLKIHPDKIRDVIGPGGKTINAIIDATGVQIDIEDDGTVFVTGTNAEKTQQALDWIGSLTRVAQVGETFQGKVTRIMDFGAFVEFLPKQEGLVHISELAPFRVGKVTDSVALGETIPVKIIEIDELGRINLSMKQAAGNKYEGMDPKNYPKSAPFERNGNGGGHFNKHR
ncbi:MAG: polyribonucleotide nucleotidyltransferase [bacterium]